MSQARTAVWLLATVAVVLGALNIMLLRELVTLRQSGDPVVAATAADASRPAPDKSRYRVYLVFSPARCSSHFVPQLESWPELFQRFHGADVWMEAVAVDTSEGELGRFWQALGLKIPVTIDRDKEVIRRFGIKQIPAKLVVEDGGEVVYREEFPELYPNEVLAELLARTASSPAGLKQERREP